MPGRSPRSRRCSDLVTRRTAIFDRGGSGRPERRRRHAGHLPSVEGDLTARRDLDLAYDQFWWDRGSSDGRTSLVVDPPDGRIPFTAEGRQRMDARRALRNRPAHGPEDRSPGERCAHHTKAGPPMSAGGYNNHLRLLQTPDHVVIWTEQIHDARIIPMDGRAPSPGKHPAVDGELTWSLGGRHPGRRDDPFQRSGQLSRVFREPASRRTVHPCRG